MTTQRDVDHDRVIVEPRTDVVRQDGNDLGRDRSEVLDRRPAYATAATGVQTPGASSYWPDRVRWGPI